MRAPLEYLVLLVCRDLLEPLDRLAGLAAWVILGSVALPDSLVRPGPLDPRVNSVQPARLEVVVPPDLLASKACPDLSETAVPAEVPAQWEVPDRLVRVEVLVRLGLPVLLER